MRETGTDERRGIEGTGGYGCRGIRARSGRIGDGADAGDIAARSAEDRTATRVFVVFERHEIADAGEAEATLASIIAMSLMHILPGSTHMLRIFWEEIPATAA